MNKVRILRKTEEKDENTEKIEDKGVKKEQTRRVPLRKKERESHEKQKKKTKNLKETTKNGGIRRNTWTK